MAVLEIDEMEARFLRANRRSDEIAYQIVNLSVRETRILTIDSESLVEQRMVIENARLEPVLAVGPCEATGMSELETDHQVFSRVAMFGVRANERSSQAGQRASRFISGKQLIGVGPSIMPHGDCLATPDQLGAAGAKIAPAPNGQLRRPSILGAVPALHWQDAEAISDIEAVKLEGAC